MITIWSQLKFARGGGGPPAALFATTQGTKKLWYGYAGMVFSEGIGAVFPSLQILQKFITFQTWKWFYFMQERFCPKALQLCSASVVHHILFSLEWSILCKNGGVRRHYGYVQPIKFIQNTEICWIFADPPSKWITKLSFLQNTFFSIRAPRWKCVKGKCTKHFHTGFSLLLSMREHSNCPSGWIPCSRQCKLVPNVKQFRGKLCSY